MIWIYMYMYISILILYPKQFNKFVFYTVPIIVRLRAHTSKVAFLQALMTQWYWKRYRPVCEQFCSTDSQFIFSAAVFQDVRFVGHSSTYLTVKFDFSHNVIAMILKKSFDKQITLNVSN